MTDELREKLGDISALVEFFGWSILGRLELNDGHFWTGMACLVFALIACLSRLRWELRFWSKVWNR